MALLARQLRFGCGTTIKVVHSGKTAGSDLKVDSGSRVFNAQVRNEGDQNVVVNLQGSDDGGTTWTTRGTVTVKARSTGMLSGAIRGREEDYRITANASSGETEGHIEVFNESDAFTR